MTERTPVTTKFSQSELSLIQEVQTMFHIRNRSKFIREAVEKYCQYFRVQHYNFYHGKMY